MVCLRFLLYFTVCFFLLSPTYTSAAAPQLSHGVTYKTDMDITDYLVSEKLDGVRAYWDGTNLMSRKGTVFHAPEWFISNFPARPLDGELWIGRGQFEEVVSIVMKKKPIDAEWRRVKYMLFELPEASGTFQMRYSQMQQLVAQTGADHLQVILQEPVTSHQELDAKLDQVVANGAEGLMLHKASAPYRVGRSDDIVKLKRYSDAEATVVGHIPGKNGFKGMLGSLVVETERGIRFRIGTGFNLEERQNPPPIGSVITYKYYGYTAKGIPRFASFLRIRREL